MIKVTLSDIGRKAPARLTAATTVCRLSCFRARACAGALARCDHPGHGVRRILLPGASPPSASCRENYVITNEVSGLTLRLTSWRHVGIRIAQSRHREIGATTVNQLLMPRQLLQSQLTLMLNVVETCSHTDHVIETSRDWCHYCQPAV
jgi:hypothetical protein